MPEYWLVDPDEPSLTVLRLVDGRYEEAAKVLGDEPYVATYPFPVTIVPSEARPPPPPDAVAGRAYGARAARRASTRSGTTRQ